MDAAARAVLTHRWADALRLATAGLADHEAAQALALRAATDLVTQWSEVDATGHPSTWLAHRIVSGIPAPPVQPSPVPDIAGAGLESAWRALRPIERAAYALVVLDRRDPVEASPILGMPPGEVSSLVTTAERRLEEECARARAEGAPDLLSTTEAAVEEMLSGRHPGGITAEEAVRTIEQQLRRASRRRRATVVGTVALVATVAGVVGVRGTDRLTPTPTPTAARPTPTPTATGLATWPARGPLATDPTIVAGVARRYLGAQRVLFADRSDGRTRILLAPRVTPVDQPPFGFLLSGPADATVAELTEAQWWSGSMGFGGRSGALAVTDATTPERRVVVLAAPGVDSIEVSRHVDVQADGRLARTWETQGLPDGAGLVTATSSLPALQLRVGTQVLVPEAAMPKLLPGQFFGGTIDSDLTLGAQGLVTAAKRDAAGALGVDPATLAEPEVIWEGEGSPDLVGLGLGGSAPRVVWVRLRLPSGFLVQSYGVVSEIDGHPQWSLMSLNEPVAAADALAPLTLGLNIADITDGTTKARVQVFVPTGWPVRSVSLSRYGREGPPMPVDGSVVLELPEVEQDVAVLVAKDADGNLVSKRALYGSSQWSGSWDVYRDAMGAS